MPDGNTRLTHFREGPLGMTYACPRCKYNTDHRYSLLQHLRRKKPCVLVLAKAGDSSDSNAVTSTTADADFAISVDAEVAQLKNDLESAHGSKSRTRTDGTAFTCSTCGKHFNFRAALSKHRNKACGGCCSNRGEEFHTPPEAGALTMITSTKRDAMPRCQTEEDARIEELQKRFDVLQGQMEDMRRRPITTTTNYNDNRVVNNNHNTNVQINALGHEDLTGITPQLLDMCIRRTTKGLVELMEKIHFDTGAPNNQNLRASLQHPEQVEYHDGDSWKYGPKNRVIRQVVDSSHLLMSSRYDDSQQDLRKSMSHAMYEFIDRWMNKMTKSNAQVYVDVMSEVYCSILNRTRSFGDCVESSSPCGAIPAKEEA